MIRKMEKGQSMVLVTLLLFAFFAILALVLDGGFLYYLRRNAQNAADAGALAGVDDLCKFKSVSQAETVAVNFANDNLGEVESTVSAQVTSYFGTSVGGIVEVWTEIEYQTFFARLLNINTITPPAYAKAGCAPPAGTSVMPVAWSCRNPIDEFGVVEPGCEVIKVDTIEQCTWPEARDKMYIIADSEDIEVETLCLPDGNVDCDLDGDGSDDLILLSGGDRSWLDLDGGGGGAAELIDWIAGDYESLYIRPHTWVPVQTGVTGSVYTSVVNNIIDKRVVMPIFDLFCPDGAPPQPGCPVHTAAETGLGYPDLIIGNDPQDYFHIIAFSYWVTTCVDSAQHGPCPARAVLDTYLQQSGLYTGGDIQSLKTMEGCFVSGTAIGIGGEPGQGLDTGVYLTFLME